MALKKNHLKTKKNICRVTFNLPANDSSDSIYIVGDFNEWDPKATPMKKGRQGFSATLDLQSEREYQFRYLVNDAEWRNDDEADGFVSTPYGDGQNCVVSTSS
jgi:1,4-alpha-glucan branching enzyme